MWLLIQIGISEGTGYQFQNLSANRQKCRKHIEFVREIRYNIKANTDRNIWGRTLHCLRQQSLQCFLLRPSRAPPPFPVSSDFSKGFWAMVGCRNLVHTHASAFVIWYHYLATQCFCLPLYTTICRECIVRKASFIDRGKADLEQEDMAYLMADKA